MSATNCDIRINIEGVPPLKSDKELDAFLWKHRASFESLTDIQSDKTFSISLDPASETVSKIEESFKDSFEDIITGNKEIKHAIDSGRAGAVGVTKMYEFVGNIDR